MDLSQIGESLVGKKVEGTVEGVKVRGTVTKVSEDEYGSTVLIQTDKPTRFFEADDDYETGGGYKKYNKIALTKGEMRDFQLVSDSNKKHNTMKLKDTRNFEAFTFDELSEDVQKKVLQKYRTDVYNQQIDIEDWVELTDVLLVVYGLETSGNYSISGMDYDYYWDTYLDKYCQGEQEYDDYDAVLAFVKDHTDFDLDNQGLTGTYVDDSVCEYIKKVLNGEEMPSNIDEFAERLGDIIDDGIKDVENSIKQDDAIIDYMIANEWLFTADGRNIQGASISDSRRVKDDRFDDVTGEIQKGVDAYADMFYPYDQSNPENSEFLRNNRDRFKKHFSGRGVSVSERELSGRNGLYFERMKDSRRVKDSEDNEEVAEVVVSVIGGESMSNAEGRKYANEIKNAIEYKQFSQGGEWCESQDFEWMDRVGEGESVAVWGIVYGSSWNTIKSSVEEWVESLGFDVDVELYDYVE